MANVKQWNRLGFRAGRRGRCAHWRTRCQCLAFLLVCVAAGPASTQSLPKGLDSLQAVLQGRPPKSTEDLKQMQDRVRQLCETIEECTVSLEFGLSHGSGVVVSSDGYVLTVAHVVGKPNKPVLVHFADGRVALGTSLGMHLELDAGIVKLNDPGPWRYLPMASSKVPPPGTWCLAAGHPGGLDLDRGPVMRLGRVLNNSVQDGDLIRTDCQLVGGDSGGPLVNLQGKVIAVNSRIGVSVVNNLHVPIAVYRKNWDQMVQGKVWQSRAYVGIRGDADLTSARVVVVHPDSPAEHAGVQPGDVIVQFDGDKIQNFQQFVTAVREQQPGETVTMHVLRDDQPIVLDVTIAVKE